MKGNSYRAGLCGLGNIAWVFDRNCPESQTSLSHAGAYGKEARTTLVAGFSPDRQDRDLFGQAFGLPTYDSLEEMLVVEKPDIVSICSPSQAHYAQGMACLDHDIAMIWLEKPPALSLAEVDALAAQATKKQATVMVNYQRRYLPIYQELRRRISSGAIGTCRQIQINYSKGLETNGVHLLDLLFFIAGDQTRYRLRWLAADGDEANPSFGLDLGALAVVVSGSAVPYHNIDIVVTGDEGRISVLHGGMTGRVEQRSEHEMFPGFYRLRDEEDHSFADLAGLAGGMEKALEDLIDSHEAGRPPLSNLGSAARSMSLIEAVRRCQAEERER